MKDRITEIELKIEFSKLTEIVQEWATETNFVVHEKNNNRVLYMDKRKFLGTKWISIENIGLSTKLSAWIAPKNLDPDAKGNFWKGNKAPIPMGYVIGPLRHFKEQFKDLLERLNSASNNAPAHLNGRNANPPAVSKENFAKGFLVLAIIIFLNGALSVFNGASSMTNQLSPVFAKSLLQNGIIDVVIGTVMFISSRLLKNGRALSIWLYGATLLFSVGQDIAIGAQFPFITILFGTWAISQLVGLKKQGQLV